MAPSSPHLPGDLAEAGVKRINVSLDTLDSELFRKLSRRDKLNDVLRGIAAASEAGLKVKLNTVALKGLNEEEIPYLIEWAHAQGHDITLIEIDAAGRSRGGPGRSLPPARCGARRAGAALDADAKRCDDSGGPARYVDVAETGGRLGFITPLTNNFCAGCNRIRVTATGQLYACLGGAEQVDLRAALRSDDPGDAACRSARPAMRIKPERHNFEIDARGAAPAQPRHMSLTGG